ncbi:hypothetical protein Pmani_015466 [Petrolisthes manimaculis]|uniref:Uncharacterized protein n=1 Tax=Petrolisthes manimaculis TaxID=1843537 RepID=A0AAE1PTU3_9EUCA|nr:hypothetical protein Pmani_015466 [Petrolisthes manimaculis]
MTTVAKFYMLMVVMMIVTAEGKEEPPTPPLSPHQAFTQFVHESLEKYTQQANSVEQQDEDDNEKYMWTKLAKHIVGSKKDDSHSQHPPAVPPTAAYPPAAFQMDDLASIFMSAMMKMNHQEDMEEDKERDLSSLAASVLSKSFLYGSSDHEETEESNE